MRKQKNSNPQAGSDRVANKLAACILWIQKRWSDKMAVMMKNLSLKARWAVCLSFILLMTGLSGYLVVESIMGKRKYLDSKIKITVPALPSVVNPVSANSLPDGVSNRIKNFKAYLDSLGSTEQGRNTRDSILSIRKGLMDSIVQLEKLYPENE